MAVEPRDPVVAFLGGAILGVGALVTALCGSCTLLFGIGLLSDAMSGRRQGGEFQVDFPTVAIIGGVPTAIGLALYFVGRALHRSASKPQERAGVSDD